MQKILSQNSTQARLYPPIDPYETHVMPRDGGHRIYVEQVGNPSGVPVMVLHGGPGGGCSPLMRRFFNPKIYRIILFDQRGCGRSTPKASVTANTTWDLVGDIEAIRAELGLGPVISFGGSWGATLALVHAIAHPHAVRHLVLRGVFLGTQAELDWFYGGGAGQFWPEAWERFVALIPKDERADLIYAYHKRLFGGDLPVEIQYAQSWSLWENALASVSSNGHGGALPADYARAFARLENHYFTNKLFLGEDNWILRNAGKLQGIPGHIVQGRYDMICPPTRAYQLHKAWGASTLRMIPNAGHAITEAGISAELIRIMDHI